MAKNRKTTPEEFAAQEERSRHFYKLLEKRRARDLELRSARQKPDASRKSSQ